MPELGRLRDADENDLATSLLIFPQGFEIFDDYLDLLDWFEQFLELAAARKGYLLTPMVETESYELIRHFVSH